MMSSHPTAESGVLAIDAGNSKTDVLLVASDGTVLGRARGGGLPAARGRSGRRGRRARAAPRPARDGGGADPARRRTLGRPGLGMPGQRRPGGGAGRLQQPDRATAMGCHDVRRQRHVRAAPRRERDAPGGRGRVWCRHQLLGTAAGRAHGPASPPSARSRATGAAAPSWPRRRCGGHHARSTAAGPSPRWRDDLPEHFGVADMAALLESLHLGVITEERVQEVTPLLFRAADRGDPVAVSLVQRQADEIVALAVSAMHRLDLMDDPVDVVLGGGVLTAGHALLLDAIDAGLAERAPKANARVVTRRPWSEPPCSAWIGSAPRARPRPGSGAASPELARRGPHPRRASYAVGLKSRRNSRQRDSSGVSPMRPAAVASAASARRKPRFGSCLLSPVFPPPAAFFDFFEVRTLQSKRRGTMKWHTANTLSHPPNWAPTRSRGRSENIYI